MEEPPSQAPCWSNIVKAQPPPKQEIGKQNCSNPK
ncbi:hypothetical protein CK203_067749 [Vitis vinifera]|uniref:Uncharacterized protein n=1 Tax=Vitis vinifera TaxID=29760 RepID=A0A438BZN1_VITVI|nr:hypothetical protein CK203_067749 [Vitis vinifera]